MVRLWNQLLVSDPPAYTPRSNRPERPPPPPSCPNAPPADPASRAAAKAAVHLWFIASSRMSWSSAAHREPCFQRPGTPPGRSEPRPPPVPAGTRTVPGEVAGVASGFWAGARPAVPGQGRGSVGRGQVGEG